MARITSFFLIFIVAGQLSCQFEEKALLENEKDILVASNVIFKRMKLCIAGGVFPNIKDAAFNSKSGEMFVATGPSNLFLFNLLKFKYDLNETIKDPKAFETDLGNGGINVLSFSPDYVYLAGGGKLGHVVVMKNDYPLARFSFDSEINAIEIHDNLIGVGTIGGKVSVINPESGGKNFENKVLDSVSSITFVDRNRLWVGGAGDRIVELDSDSGDIIRSFEFFSGVKRFLHIIGFKPCPEPSVNLIVFEPSKKMVLTTHGGDYCSYFGVNLWDFNSGQLVKEIDWIKNPIMHGAWVPEVHKYILVDSKLNLWKIDGDSFYVSGPFNLYQRLSVKDPSNNPLNIPFGGVNGLDVISGSSHVIVSVGSYFSGGPGVYVVDVGSDSIKIVSFFNMAYPDNKIALLHFSNTQSN